jgi:two-component sensor histidine kinase
LRAFGEALPAVVPLEAHQKALQTGADQIGGVLLGPVAKRPSLGIFVPVMKAGKAERTIVIGLDPKIFTRVLENQELPEGWVAGVGDPQGKFVARSIDNDRFVGRPISRGWLDASRNGKEGLIENISQEGIPLISAFTNLSDSNWTVSVGASKEVVNSPAHRSRWIVGTVSAAFVLLSLTLSWFAGRSIIGAMKSLENASSSLLRNEPVNLKRTGLREVDHALTAFERAASTISEREKHHELLVEELNHRVKNTLAVVQSMAVLAKQTATSVSSYSASFISRIVSLAHTHDLLTASNWEDVQLKGILENELGVYQNAGSARVSLSGENISLDSKEAVAISMIVHELATNAAKYGSLSQENGRLRVVWYRVGETVTVDWSEENGPPVVVTERSGFGTRLIASLAASLGGKATMEMLPEGARFILNFPKSAN